MSLQQINAYFQKVQKTPRSQRLEVFDDLMREGEALLATVTNERHRLKLQDFLILYFHPFLLDADEDVPPC
jgi:hypothetical protein